MLTAASGLSSGNQVSTYQQNRTNANPIISNMAFMSKPELRKSLEFVCLENEKIQEKNNSLSIENQQLRDEVMRVRKKLLIRQTEMINHEGKDHIVEFSFLKAV
jgi:hypothetical protein